MCSSDLNLPPRLLIRSLDSTDFRVLPSEVAAWPFWSPDNNSIAYSSGGNKLKVVDTRGVSSYSLADIANMRGVAWTPERTLIYSNAGTGKAQMWEVPVAGGTPKLVLASDLDTRFPTLLPDGRHILFTSAISGETAGIYLGSRNRNDAENATPRKLLPDVSMARVVPAIEGHDLILLFVRQSNLVGVRMDGRSYALVGEVFPIAEGVSSVSTAAHYLFSASQTGTLVYVHGADFGKNTFTDRKSTRLNSSH